MAQGKKSYKYQIINEQLQPYGHMLYLIRYTAKNGAVSEQWIGQSRLKRFYEQDRLTGALSEHVMLVVTAELKKSQGRTRGKIKLTPRDENYVRRGAPNLNEPVAKVVESHWIKDKAEITKPKGWSLNEEWLAPSIEPENKDLKINIKAYSYEKEDWWHVVQCDGTEDEDGPYSHVAIAQRVVDILNNPVKE